MNSQYVTHAYKEKNMLSDKDQLLTRRKQWEIFNDWETSLQKRNEEHAFASLCKWYSDAWEMARSLNPNWANGLDHEKILHLQKMREALALIGDTHERFRAKS